MSTDTRTQADKDADRIEGRHLGNGDSAPELSEQAIKPWEGYLAAIPDAGGAGYESILQQLNAAQSVADLNAPWAAGGLEDFEGRQLIVRGLRKMPSDFEGGLHYFLVVDAIEKVSGQVVTLTTGSIGIVGQLAKAHALGALPVTVVPRKSERRTKAGYEVWHLEFVQ